MKKGMFLPVLFILGFVAGATARSSALFNVDGAFDNATNWASTSTTIVGVEAINSSIYSDVNSVLLIGVAPPVYNSNISESPNAKPQTCTYRTSRINSICRYRLKSLTKD